MTAEDREEVTLHLIADSGLSTCVDDVGAEHARSGWPVEEVTVPGTPVATLSSTSASSQARTSTSS